jgi:hypothetical protein
MVLVDDLTPEQLRLLEADVAFNEALAYKF